MQLISNKNIPVGKKISDPVLERVSDALEKSPLSDEEIASKVGVSSTTVWRWRTKKKGRTNEMILKALAETLDVNYRWLHFGKGPRDNDPNLNQIKSAKDDAGESYKGLDQTLLNVELKAENLKQDLQSLIDDLRKLRSDS